MFIGLSVITWYTDMKYSSKVRVLIICLFTHWSCPFVENYSIARNKWAFRTSSNHKFRAQPVITPKDFIFIISFTVSFQNSIVIIAHIQCWADFQQKCHIRGPTLALIVIWWSPLGTLKFYDCYYKVRSRRHWREGFWFLLYHFEFFTTSIHCFFFWEMSHVTLYDSVMLSRVSVQLAPWWIENTCIITKEIWSL